jgi:hypothetical protein
MSNWEWYKSTQQDIVPVNSTSSDSPTTKADSREMLRSLNSLTEYESTLKNSWLHVSLMCLDFF